MDTKESPLNRRDDEKPESSEKCEAQEPKRTTIEVPFTDKIVQDIKEFCYADDRTLRIHGSRGVHGVHRETSRISAAASSRCGGKREEEVTPSRM